MKKGRKEEEATTEGRELGPPSANAGKERRAGGRDRGKRENLPQGGNVRIGALHCFAAAAAAVTVVHSCRSFCSVQSLRGYRRVQSADLAFVYLSGVPYLY